MEDQDHNPMNHPAEQPAGSDGDPKFGRLLVVLLFAVLVIVAITYISERLYT